MLKIGDFWSCGVGAWSYGVGKGLAFAGWVFGTVRASTLFLPRTVATLAQAEILIGNLERTVAGTAVMFDVLQSLLIRAAGTLDDARSLLDEAGRLTTLMTVYEGPLTDLAPAVGRIAETMNPAEVDALKDLAGQLRVLLTDELLPMLHQLRGLGPDAHGVLESLDNLGRSLRSLSMVGRPRHPAVVMEEQNDASGPVTAAE